MHRMMQIQAYTACREVDPVRLQGIVHREIGAGDTRTQINGCGRMRNSASGIICADLVVAGIRRFSATPSVWSIVSSPSTVADFRCGCCHAVYALAACPPRRALPVCTNCGPTLDSSGRRADPRCADQGGIRARGRASEGLLPAPPDGCQARTEAIMCRGAARRGWRRRGIAEFWWWRGGGRRNCSPRTRRYPPLLSTPPPRSLADDPRRGRRPGPTDRRRRWSGAAGLSAPIQLNQLVLCCIVWSYTNI